ncbi:MAG: N-glycosylase/DNA lyase [Endomicrobiia bacterium]
MELLKDYKMFFLDIQKRKQEFLENKNNKEKIFKELCFCILTPQSKAVNCWQAVEELFDKGFPSCRPETIRCILRKKVRFYKNKTNYIIEVAKKFDIIYKMLKKDLQSDILREILVREIKGIGYKEASHFLRNIGYSFDLAILDRHILKNLKLLGVIKNLPKTLSKKEYLKIEKKFIEFSNKVKIPLVDIDLLLWAKQTGFVFK